ncbi:MAG: histidine phosphatase family protein [Bowdeniella nasicola]|nr:histidine phosphatase family protein [Bowdeniella nasicola]
MTRTTIHLMRHGEVDNPEGILYGRMPGFHLSELGVTMATRVAKVLADGGHDVVFVGASPLERAQESAAPSARAYGLPVHTFSGLIEADNDFAGLDVNSSRALLAHPKYWWRYRNPLRPSWGESYRDQVTRMVGVIREVLHTHARGGEALLVSHQLPIWVTRLFLERRNLAHDPRNRQCALASLTTLTFDDARLVGLAYWEPAGDLLTAAADMVPGTSAAQLNTTGA